MASGLLNSSSSCGCCVASSFFMPRDLMEGNLEVLRSPPAGKVEEFRKNRLTFTAAELIIR
jgi:hypothetical protein